MPDKAQASGAMNGINLGLAVVMLVLIGLLPWSFFTNFVVLLLGLGLIGLSRLCLKKPVTG